MIEEPATNGGTVVPLTAAPGTAGALRPDATTVLVADPDQRLGGDLVSALCRNGVRASVCADGAQALLRTGSMRPDLLLVSARLPVVDAVTFIRVVRGGTDTPVILGVGGDDAAEAVRALQAGATACVARPYRLPELLPLINNVGGDGAGSEWQSPHRLACGPVELDGDTYEVRKHGQLVPMPPREFELLRYLMLNADRVVTRQQIQRQVWRDGGDGPMTNTLTVHIMRLRERLGDDPESPGLILTIRGVGYRLVRPR